MKYLQEQILLWQQAEKHILSRLGGVVKSWFKWLHQDPAHLSNPDHTPVFALEKALREALPLAAMSTVQLAQLERKLHLDQDGTHELLARYYSQHAPQIASGATDDIQARLRILLFRAKQQGASERDAAAMMLQAGLPFTKGRLRNIARTELTNASTLGRLGLYRHNDLQIMRYNNVLDDRTTRTCRTAAGLLLDLTRPEDLEILPANHYFCRSLITPAYGVKVGSNPEAIHQVIEVRNQEFPGWISRLRPFVEELYAS